MTTGHPKAIPVPLSVAEILCNRLRHVLLVACLMQFAPCAVWAENRGSQVSWPSGTKGLRVILPADIPQVHGVTITAAAARREYERRGFFRIGLLPLFVLEGVKVELNTASFSSVTNAVARISDWVSKQGRSKCELRNVSFSRTGEEPVFLEVGRIRISSVADETPWHLLDGVCLRVGSDCFSGERATLRPSRPQGPANFPLRHRPASHSGEIPVLTPSPNHADNNIRSPPSGFRAH